MSARVLCSRRSLPPCGSYAPSCAELAPPCYWSKSQYPPRHRPEQQSVLTVHEPATGVQFVGGWHVPLLHTLLQQSAAVMHAPAVGVHCVTQSPVVRSHVPLQHSAFVVHEAFCALHVSEPKPQRFGSVSLSQTIEQHPFCGPALHVSPRPRHSVFAGSSSHVPASQMFEQHCELVVQGSLCTAQICPPHVPLLQLRSQQSIAFSQAAPFPAHTFAHWVTPVIPCTGSQRELQQSLVGPAVHDAPGARQVPAGRHTLP